MSKIRGQNTLPERKVRSLLHRLGYRFRLHDRRLPGKPDVVLSRHKVAVFVHGCFWHRHPGCRFAYEPKSRQDFWERKFDNNRERDKRTLASLKVLGWRPIVVWECELAEPARLARRLKRAISGGPKRPS